MYNDWLSSMNPCFCKSSTATHAQGRVCEMFGIVTIAVAYVNYSVSWMQSSPRYLQMLLVIWGGYD